MTGLSLFEVARRHPGLSLWLALVRAAGWDASLESGGPWTALAPHDDAFARLVGSGRLADLGSTVAGHLLPGRWTARDLARARTVPTADGAPLEVASLHGAIRLGPAIVTRGDVPAHNGILHVVDAVVRRAAA